MTGKPKRTRLQLLMGTSKNRFEKGIFYTHKATEVMPSVHFGIQVTMQSFSWCVKEVTQWPIRV